MKKYILSYDRFVRYLYYLFTYNIRYTYGNTSYGTPVNIEKNAIKKLKM